MHMSTIIVVPPDSAALVPHSKSSAETVPMKGNSQCVCGSMPPGSTKAPPASMTSALAGTLSPSPTAAICPPSISTSARREASWFTTVPPRISMVIAKAPACLRQLPLIPAQAGIQGHPVGRTGSPLSRGRAELGAATLLQRHVRDRMRPRAGRRLGDHRRLAAAAEQRLHGALVVSRVECAVRAFGQLVDLAEHARLMLLGLRTGRVVGEHDLDGFRRIGAGIIPAFERRFDELGERRGELRIGDLAL